MAARDGGGDRKVEGGLTAREQRVPGVNIKDYFYVIDPEKLRVLNGKFGNARSHHVADNEAGHATVWISRPQQWK
jgi:hypothetical protein